MVEKGNHFQSSFPKNPFNSQHSLGYKNNYNFGAFTIEYFKRTKRDPRSMEGSYSEKGCLMSNVAVAMF